MTDVYSASKLAQQYSSGNRQTAIDRANRVVSVARRLRPGARRLLLRLHRLFERQNFKSVTRSEIAAEIEHSKLFRYDLLMLDYLVAAGFIQVKRVALPIRNRMPRGAAFHYSMTIDVGWLLSKTRTS